MTSSDVLSEEVELPSSFTGIGYTKAHDGFPMESFDVPVPRPSGDQVLIHVVSSSLNPLDYKLAALNFFQRTPPVVLGFDIAGIVVAKGALVVDFAVGDEVVAMADSSGDGGWAVGGHGGFALARDFLTVKKPKTLSFVSAGVLPVCFISAFSALCGNVRAGDIVYIPGGAGGVGHLAVQMAARTMGAGRVISSGSTKESLKLAKAMGAHHVFNYKTDDISAEIAELTNGRGVDLVFDATYSEASYVNTADMVRKGGVWTVLGVGPGKTSRTTVTESPVDAMLSRRNARHINVNLLRYFSEPTMLTLEVKSMFRKSLNASMEWAVGGTVVPHVSKVINSTVAEINVELTNMKNGQRPLGKVGVVVDQTVVVETERH